MAAPLLRVRQRARRRRRGRGRLRPRRERVTALTVAAPRTGTGRPRNVFLVANNVEEVGGLQRVAHGLAQELARRGHHVVLVGINHHPDQVTYVDDPAYETVVLNETPEPRPL